jgi:hypothetical protein
VDCSALETLPHTVWSTTSVHPHVLEHIYSALNGSNFFHLDSIQLLTTVDFGGPPPIRRVSDRDSS